MRYVEKLDWILDAASDRLKAEDEYQINIDFVHSLGLKCDCVGWSTLTLGTPEADRVLDAIADFCKREGWYARGWYTREYVDVESDWYVLEADFFKDGTLDHSVEVPAEDGSTLKLSSLKAYRELMPAPKKWGAGVLVPDRFRKAFLRADLKGGTFNWAKDTGKYRAEQYFHLFADRQIPQYSGGERFDYCEWKPSPETGAYPPVETYERILALGGTLPKLAKIFYNLHVSLPVCLLASDLTAKELDGVDIASINGADIVLVSGTILLRNSAAEALYKNGGVTMNYLRAIPIMESFPEGYKVRSTVKQALPNKEYVAQSMDDYEKLMANPRPVRKIGEKDALKVLRATKKERKEEFLKALPKAMGESLAGTEYGLLLPYYQITRGGDMSDEYRLLPVEEAVTATEEWREELAKEELLETSPTGVVIARCPDGDVVVLTTQGAVIRFSHEAPETIRQWEDVAAFVYDAITESE